MSAQAIAGSPRPVVPAEIDAEHARGRLDREIMRRPVAIRPRLAEGRDRDVDDFWRTGGDRFIADAQPVDHARPKRLHEHVRGLGQAQQRLDPGRVLEVEGQALLAAMGVGEIDANAVALGADAAVRLALVGFDLDHLGAVIGHHLGHRRPRQEQGEVDDADAFELHRPPSGRYQEGSRFCSKAREAFGGLGRGTLDRSLDGQRLDVLLGQLPARPAPARGAWSRAPPRARSARSPR